MDRAVPPTIAVARINGSDQDGQGLSPNKNIHAKPPVIAPAPINPAAKPMTAAKAARTYRSHRDTIAPWGHISASAMGGKRTLRLSRFNNRVVYPCGFERPKARSETPSRLSAAIAK